MAETLWEEVYLTGMAHLAALQNPDLDHTVTGAQFLDAYKRLVYTQKDLLSTLKASRPGEGSSWEELAARIKEQEALTNQLIDQERQLEHGLTRPRVVELAREIMTQLWRQVGNYDYERVILAESRKDRTND
jgi:hypothetical protein